MGGGANSNLFGTAGPNVMQPGPVPGSGLAPVPPQITNMPTGPTPNLGAAPAPMPQLAPGVTLPPQRRSSSNTPSRMIAMGKALQSFGAQQQQPPRRGAPVNFNQAPMPYIPPPNTSSYTGD